MSRTTPKPNGKAKNAKATRPRRHRKPSTREGVAANAEANRSAEALQLMTRAERNRRLKGVERSLASHAPTLEAAESDLLMMLQLVGMAFAERYYPDAGHINFHISGGGMLGDDERWYVILPVPTPAKKGGGK